MNLRPTTQEDIDLCRRMERVFVLVQLAAGVFLAYHTVVLWLQGILALCAVAVWILLKCGWEKRACRVIARLVTGIVWLFAAAFLAETITCIVVGFRETVSTLCSDLCTIMPTVLTWLAVGAVMVGLRGGRYDRVVGCFVQTWLLLTAALCVFTGTKDVLIWSWDNDIVRYIWFGIVAVTTLLMWTGAVARVTAAPVPATVEE